MSTITQTEAMNRYDLSRKEIDLLPAPTIKKRRGGGFFKIYQIEDVISLHERLSADPTRQAKIQKKRAAALKALQTRRERLRASVPDHQISDTWVWPETIEDLLTYVHRVYVEMYDSSREQGMRGIIAALRHRAGNYDEICSYLRGQVGGSDLYEEVRIEVDMEIQGEILFRYPEIEKYLQ